MMTRKSSFLFLIIFIFINFSLNAQNNSSDNKTASWCIAAEEFTFNNKISVKDEESGLAKMFPVLIMEKLDTDITRTIYPDEQIERVRYESKKERMSLFLQLSAAMKTRDALVLYGYSDFEFALKQKEQNKNIEKIQKKIDENLAKLEKEEIKAQKDYEDIKENSSKQKTEGDKIVSFFKSFFSNNSNLYTKENVVFYNNSISSLYKRPQELQDKEYDSFEFEQTMVKSNINTLISGNITKVGDYFSVTVNVYSYPGAKKLITVTDVGSTNDVQLIVSNMIKEFIPVISNSMPVEIKINVTNEDIKKENVSFFIDNAIQTDFSDSMIIQNGVHYIQFVCPGYKNAGTNFFFEGNRKYNIDVIFEKETEKTLTLNLKNSLFGNIYANGVDGSEIKNDKTSIKIDDKAVLGNFITLDGKTDFYYIPKNLVEDNVTLSVNLKPIDKEKYIDNRRKAMYFSYSLLMVSLIPSFYTFGNYTNYSNLYKAHFCDYTTAKNWENGYYISMGISIGCGVLFVYELVRYLVAVNGILPKTAKPVWGNNSNNDINNNDINIENDKSIEKNETVIVDNTETAELELTDKDTAKETENKTDKKSNNNSIEHEEEIETSPILIEE